MKKWSNCRRWNFSGSKRYFVKGEKRGNHVEKEVAGKGVEGSPVQVPFFGDAPVNFRETHLQYDLLTAADPDEAGHFLGANCSASSSACFLASRLEALPDRTTAPFNSLTSIGSVGITS